VRLLSWLPGKDVVDVGEVRIEPLPEPHTVTTRLNDRGEAEFAGRNDEGDFLMKCLAAALGTLLLALAVTPSANAVVRPEWVVVRWAYVNCKIWHNDVNGPAGAGWKAVAFAGSYPEARAKLQGLYGTRVCV
jgi:hypothetical protein